MVVKRYGEPVISPRRRRSPLHAGRPKSGGVALALFVIQWQIDFHREVYAVRALVFYELLMNAAQLWRGIGVICKTPELARGSGADEIVWRVVGSFVRVKISEPSGLISATAIS